MATITNLTVEIIQDSRGVDTLSVTVFSGNLSGTFSVPSGASTGIHEAHELRDTKDSHSSVTKAKQKIDTLVREKLIGMDATNQRAIDEMLIALDATEQKTNLGGNSTLGVSIACAKLAAASRDLPLYAYLQTLSFSIERSRKAPYLYLNMINGGKHANSPIAFQEYHLIPDTESIEEALVVGKAVQIALKSLIQSTYEHVVTGDEGGYALPVSDVEIPLILLTQAVEIAGYEGKCVFALDVAASSFYSSTTKTYHVNNKDINQEELSSLYEDLLEKYPIISIEDPYHEEDFESFALLQKNHPTLRVIGDDLTVTNTKRLTIALKAHSIRGLIIKPNQIGTLTETLETMTQARLFNADCIVSHRSGETLDTFIADLAYAFGVYGIKAGAFGPKEREVKYQRFLEILRSKEGIPSRDIIATLGPSSHEVTTMEELLQEGATFFRLNFSWGDHKDMETLIKNIRTASANTKHPVLILQDLSGPRVQEKEGHHIDKNKEETITEKDKKDIVFGSNMWVDYVALSYVKNKEDILLLKKLLKEAGSNARVIAKIERKEAVENLEEILSVTDAVMIARGDLGLAYPLEELLLIEEKILHACKEKHVYVIVATQMMLSMTHSETPSRAEITDVEIAILHGANAVMLSEETASGEHPKEAVSYMKKAVTFTTTHKQDFELL